ncbi:hypothetical protein BT96DRAFT_175111 [Gymnopus androsaceus JB14]|uniref:Uncharacterized protein n=1 Tax=Gymnopus androsaceus JB14 TaxID=1447944 RepID=A0A6A4I909_9AGAR|nr:hypothetical protein BT96DRAFT_175111 [Gymnopus androsaceus JB14]
MAELPNRHKSLMTATPQEANPSYPLLLAIGCGGESSNITSLIGRLDPTDISISCYPTLSPAPVLSRALRTSRLPWSSMDRM